MKKLTASFCFLFFPLFACSVEIVNPNPKAEKSENLDSGSLDAEGKSTYNVKIGLSSFKCGR